MSKRPVEAWLKSEDAEQWADAVMACQSGAPWECAEAGSCYHEGSCFTTDRQAACAAWRMIQRLSSENREVQRHLDRAVAFLRYGGRPE
ncbi:hypothetical protein ACLE20_04750 [Rhizobium sp. YIM 134829]|uniref:hypothetical protein n=1 Tax=Rhizobium sp. YIM 134829 TaxID=3390453 RepID=UPI00397A8D5C